ncbi:hypothetical protein [Escherichia coli]|uniref:hypothetical protein n=1 Tax=Escherichia coli TaxID=562 RepID=UPI00259CA1BE|nr:hypothetical protein [Escherichia coli]
MKSISSFELSPISFRATVTDNLKQWQQKHTAFALTSRAPDFFRHCGIKAKRLDFSFPHRKKRILCHPLKKGNSNGHGCTARGYFFFRASKGVFSILLDKMGNKLTRLLDDGQANIIDDEVFSKDKWFSRILPHYQSGG